MQLASLAPSEVALFELTKNKLVIGQFWQMFGSDWLIKTLTVTPSEGREKL